MQTHYRAHLRGRLTSGYGRVSSGQGHVDIEDSADRYLHSVGLFVEDVTYARLLDQGIKAATDARYPSDGGYQASYPLDRYLGSPFKGHTLTVGYSLASGAPMIDWLQVEIDADQPELVPHWLRDALVAHPTLNEDIAEAAAKAVEGERAYAREQAAHAAE